MLFKMLREFRTDSKYIVYNITSRLFFVEVCAIYLKHTAKGMDLFFSYITGAQCRLLLNFLLKEEESITE